MEDLWDAVVNQELHIWRQSVGNSETGGCLAPEPYINSISTNKRWIITMLRCGCLPLEVETGRYRTPKTPLLQRTCEICERALEMKFIS